MIEEIGKDQNRAVVTDLHNILDLINCAETYGYGDEVFYDGMFEMIGKVSDGEIEVFAREQFLTDEARKQGYGEEDYENSIERLAELRDKYERP